MYKNGKYYYTSIQVDGKRIAKSLRTKDKKVAKTRERSVKIELYNEIKNGKDTRKSFKSNKSLIKAYLKDKKYKPTTHSTYYNILMNVWLTKKPFPNNKSTIESYSKHINSFYNWCNTNYKTDFQKLKYDEGHPRLRVYDKQELDLIFNSEISCNYHKQILSKDFLRFAYYTGAREGELINIVSVSKGYMVVRGKVGTRVVKLTPQAQVIIDSNNWLLWNWTPDTIQKAFKAYVRRLGIKDAQFKDLRRTFGLNYILNGGMIYQLSKLLGHKNVRTTEKHYAPLMAIFIEDFTI